MSSTHVIRVSSLLWDELPSRLRAPSDTAAADTLVLAAYLDLASESYGLSDIYEVQVVDRLNSPTAVLSLVSHYIGAPAGPIDPDEVRNAIYTALLRVVDVYQRREDVERDLRAAQVYWALSDDDDRRDRLPYRSGVDIAPDLRALIFEPDRARDLGVLRRIPRTDALAGQGMSSGVALRKHGARLAVALATEMTRSTTNSPTRTGRPDKHIEVRTVAGKHYIEVDCCADEDEEIVSTPWSGAVRPAPRGPLQDLHERAQKYDTEGLHFQAGAVRSSMVQILRQHSDSNPVESEDAIANTGLLAGFSYLEADRSDLARKEFQQATRIDELLAILNGDDASAVRLTVGRAMIAVIDLTALRYGAARQSLADSLSSAQDLADGNPAHEDLLVLVLIMIGTLEMQYGDLPRASFAFARASKIARKLLNRNPEAIENAQLASTSMLMLGMLRLIEDQLPAAQSCLAEGIEILNVPGLDRRHVRSTRYLVAGLQAFLGTAYMQSDRTVEAMEAWLNAVGSTESLDGNDLIGRGATLIRLQSLLNLGIASLEVDDALARDYAERAVQAGRRMDDSQLLNDQVLHVFGMALMVLAAAAHSLGDCPIALVSVREAVTVLQRTHGRDSDELLATAREMLDEFVEEELTVASNGSADSIVAEGHEQRLGDN